MDLGIAGKRAVVTCASSGIGLAVADALASEDVDLVLMARTQDRLNEVRNLLHRDGGPEISTFAGDMTKSNDVKGLLEATGALGGADILVLNTPRPPSPMREFLEEDEDDRWEAAHRDQLESALRVLRVMGPTLGRAGWGRIIGVTSASVKEPMPRHALSTIYRAGVQAALKHLSHELGPRGVTVNSVAPATIVTPTFSTHHNLASRVEQTSLKRGGLLEELAGTVAFLASQQAGFITGQTIQVDGGRSVSLT